MDPNRDMLNDIYKMTKENNKMLHGMRRRALVGGVIKFVFWTILLVGPVWFYYAYLNASVQQALQTMKQMQGTTSGAEEKFVDLQNTLKQLQAKIPGFSTSAQTTGQ